MNEDDNWPQEFIDLVIAMRGNPPDKCDYCHIETEVTPGEAGLWICYECLEDELRNG